MIIGYYTDKYEEEAQKFIDSLKKLDLPHEVDKVEDKGSWLDNVKYKPTFIKEKLKKLNCPVIYIDVDAEVKRYPELFDKLDCDMAYWLCHQGDYKISAGGTLYFRPKSLWVLDKWEIQCRMTCEPDQESLWEVLRKNEIKTELIPIEYCQIFDWGVQSKKPVIVHYQASRRLKC